MPMKRARKPNRPKEVIAAEKAEKAARKVTKAAAKQAKAAAKQAKAAAKQAKAQEMKAKIAGHDAQIKADGERYQKEQLTRDMEHDMTLGDIEDDETLGVTTRPKRMRNRVTYTPAARVKAAKEAEKRGRAAGIALQKRAAAAAMDKCMAAYTLCMQSNGWILSDAACDNISTETVRRHMKKPCATSEEFLAAFYEVWTKEGWSMGDPVTGEDTDDAEFDNEYHTARFNQW